MLLKAIGEDYSEKLDDLSLSITGLPKTKALQLPVSPQVLQILAVYLRHHKGKVAVILSPVRYTEMKKITNKWDAEFIDCLFEQKPLFYQVFQAAKLCLIEPLQDLCAAKIATMIKGKRYDEMISVLQE